MPPDCAATPHTTLLVPEGLAATCVQVAPRSWLTATPQSVPTNTSAAFGANEIPQVLARVEQGGFDVAGFCQVTPPSTLRQIPPPFVVRLSAQADATTICELLGANLTSDMRKGGNESMCDQVAPESVVRKRPPLSLAAMAVAVLAGLTVTAIVRPPHFTLGWNGVTDGGSGGGGGGTLDIQLSLPGSFLTPPLAKACTADDSLFAVAERSGRTSVCARACCTPCS